MKIVKFYNTLTGKKEEFKSITDGIVKMYSCGPTVYSFAHIGNFRSFLTSDLISRVLDYAGYKVEKVMNITDVGHLTNDDEVDSTGEDKISKMARKEKVDPFEISRKFEQYFLEDEKKLRIIPAKKYPRATEYIDGQINLAKKLIDEGFAYEVNGSVYFRTEKFKKYGQLSGNNLENLISGARVEINSEKESPLDFALWKKADENHLMQWESPWGQGFPGWHAECSVMSRELLGFPFDIHTGGEDNVFPHHECEIAQNECSNHGKKSVNYWLHTKHLQVEGKKMSKSAGNFYTIRDLFEKGWAGNEIRFALMSAHYRSTLNFSIKSLEQARSSINRIDEAVKISRQIGSEAKNHETELVAKFRGIYQAALFDDLNIADALAAVFSLVKEFMKLREAGELDDKTAQDVLYFLENDFTRIFDVLPEVAELNAKSREIIEKLVMERMTARKNKDWAESDRIRDLLAEKYNVEILDSAVETTWRVK
jgi:cysteinyl-tRNA synthetase